MSAEGEDFNVDGFKERGGVGGVLRVEENSKMTTAQDKEDRYQPWVQHDSWFVEQGNSEHLAGGSNRELLLQVLKGLNYQELRDMVQSNSIPLKSLYDKDSDFERIKYRAEFHYVNGEYEDAARDFMQVLSSYKIAPPRKGGGGLRFELLDSLVRCYRHMGALDRPDAQVLVDDMRAAVGGQQHAVMHALHAAFLRQAARVDESLTALQEVVARHPAEPSLWLQIAQGYRESTVPRDRASLCARRCLRFAVKMIQYCANARQCTLSLSHHAAVQAAVREEGTAHADFYFGPASTPPEDVVKVLQEMVLSDGERALLSCPEASAFERKWLAGGGEEAATTMLSKAPDASVAEMSG